MPRDTRQVILDAALDVFSERGFHGATVPEVAKRASVGAGTIYRHFENKEHLGNELYLDWKRKYVEHILTAIPESGPWRHRFRALWQAQVDFALAHPGVLEYLEFHHHSSYLEPDAEALELAERHGIALVSLFEAGQADEAFVDGPAPVLLNMVYGSFLRLLRIGASGSIALTPEVFSIAEERAWAMVRR